MNPQTNESLYFWSLYRPDKTPEYLESANKSYRDNLIDILYRYRPFDSILEIGCHCGPNYDRLASAFDQSIDYTGLDINKEVLDDFATRAKGIKLINVSIFDIVNPSPSFDLVFTSSVLSLFAPDDVERALDTMINLSSRLVVIQEPNSERHNEIFHQWNHPYLKLLSQYKSFEWSEINNIIVGIHYE